MYEEAIAKEKSCTKAASKIVTCLRAQAKAVTSTDSSDKANARRTRCLNNTTQALNEFHAAADSFIYAVEENIDNP